MNIKIGFTLQIDIKSPIIIEEEKAKIIVENICDIVGCKVICSIDKIFKPPGYSYVAIISKSTISIHTWPEYNYIGIDIFSCGQADNIISIINYLKTELKTETLEYCLRDRGLSEKV